MSNAKFFVVRFSFVFLLLSSAVLSFAQEQPAIAEKNYVTDAWKALSQGDHEALDNLVKECVKKYGKEADEQQASLNDFPSQDKMDIYKRLNDVATCLFIKIEDLVKQGKNEEAKQACKELMKQYPYAQAWDPRGWYWKIAEKTKTTLNKLEGKGINGVKKSDVSTLITTISLNDPGSEDVVDYTAYGKFEGVGTAEYKYTITDQEGLSKAVGEGIYPNTTSVRKDPAFLKARKAGRFRGGHWNLMHSPDVEAAFFRWALSPEPKGVSLFYLGILLERAGLYTHAIKAYYAIVVHFPSAVGWTYWDTPWYIGQAAIAKIKHLCRVHPELHLKLEDARIRVVNGYDLDVSNDIYVVNPGKFVETATAPEGWFGRIKKALTHFGNKEPKIKRLRGWGRVQLVQFENRDWQLRVDGKPFVIRGVTYTPTKVGQGPDDGSLKNWMTYDYNNNGKCDGPYDAFVDTNGNNKQDKDEPTIGDFQLMKDMGINVIRIYHQPQEIDKKLLRKMYEEYGIMVIMGDFLGKYALGSGATWFEGTDYTNPQHQKNMLESVKEMILEYKDEPYILMWLLGNENVYGLACNANTEPDAFFKFCNEAALLIKTIDTEHPVAVASGDVLFLDSFAKHCDEIDVFGTNAYRGDYGFGSFWQQVKELTDKPAFHTEYGCPAFASCMTGEQAEQAQADYLSGCWQDIEDNMAGGNGAGNSLGGIVFEYVDEWWKAYEPSFHDTEGLFTGPFPDGYMHEEWLGVCGQGDGSSSPFLRTLRKSYHMYQDMWSE